MRLSCVALRVVRCSGLWREVLVETAQALLPETLVVGQPVLNLGERLRCEKIASLAAMTALGDQPRVAQDTQVLRHGRTTDPKIVGKIVDWALALGQQVENTSPHRMRN